MQEGALKEPENFTWHFCRSMQVEHSFTSDIKITLLHTMVE